MRHRGVIVPELACVYFLTFKDVVVYIGETKDLSKRVSGHYDKKYDGVRFIECNDPDKRIEYEERWVRRFKPFYNKPLGCGKPMKQNDGLYIKLSEDLKKHVRDYVEKTKPKDGLSGLVRSFLIRKTEYKAQ